MDPKHAVKLLKRDEELWNVFVQVIGGRKELALEIARSLSLQMSAKDVAHILGLSPSAAGKRLNKIKAKKSGVISPKSSKNIRKPSRKPFSPKKPL